MKKAFNQTVRDIKREVNKKVLKVPGIEQKVLDATNNEAWGPHGTLLADISQASRNYHECQIIMAVIWKRINDTGKNWRHVYKALTVLDYLVANGSERVIDEIKEHSYQISTLSSFHYIDSSGRDQGTNVRKKSQSLVELVNDKERIVEVRQKAAANKDKFRSNHGGMYRPGPYGSKYDDDGYENRYGTGDDDQNGSGYGRHKEYNYNDDDRYGRFGDSRESDQYRRDSEERYNYRDDSYRGRSRSVDDYSSRSRSAERDKNGVDEDAQNSYRGIERKYSEQNINTPPTYEEAVGESLAAVPGQRDGEIPATHTSGSSSPSVSKSLVPQGSVVASPSIANNQNLEATPVCPSDPPATTMNGHETFDEFDPRGPFSGGPGTIASSCAPVSSTSKTTETDFLDSLTDSVSTNALAIMPVLSMPTSETDLQQPNSGYAFPAANSLPSQVIDDPFGDSPFTAIPSPATNLDTHPNALSLQHSANPNFDTSVVYAPNAETVNFGLGSTQVDHNPYTSANPQFVAQDLPAASSETDVLAGILPPVSHYAGAPNSDQMGHLYNNAYGDSTLQMGSSQVVTGHLGGGNQVGNLVPGIVSTPLASTLHHQQSGNTSVHFNNGSLIQHSGSAIQSMAQPYPTTFGLGVQSNGHSVAQQGVSPSVQSQFSSQMPSGTSLNSYDTEVLPQGGIHPVVTQSNIASASETSMVVPPISKDKFEPKSTVWADTLSRGLVNLNISGPKTNPLADIGVDFDAINRKERRMEKHTTPAVTSTVTMGKAMGSGSGIGRAGASVLRPQNPGVGMAAGTGMGMGMGMGMGGMGIGGGPGLASGMGGYGVMNQPTGMGMGMGMGMGINMNPGMGMNMGMRPGLPMRPQSGPVTLPGGYNPLMGPGGYGHQQPYR